MHELAGRGWDVDTDAATASEAAESIAKCLRRNM